MIFMNEKELKEEITEKIEGENRHEEYPVPKAWKTFVKGTDREKIIEEFMEEQPGMSELSAYLRLLKGIPELTEKDKEFLDKLGKELVED